MEQRENQTYEFGRFRLNSAERLLMREGEPVALTPKVFDILLVLLESGGRVVEKDDLMKRVWPTTFVEEGNLTQNISLLRKALGETPNGVQFIETVPRRGYRFVGALRTGDPLETSGIVLGQHGAGVPQSDNHSTTDQNGNLAASLIATTGSDFRPSGLPFLRTRAQGIAVIAVLLGAVLIGAVYLNGIGKVGNASTASIESIAVLPFVAEASDRDAEFLNEKISESVINSLSKLPQLRVVPRSVVAVYRGKDVDPRKIGEELNVRAVLTGRLSRHGDMISIQAEVIDVENVAQLWGQRYDRRMSDVMLVQEDISRDIFENLRLKLNVEEKKQLEAYRLYLKGRNSWNKRTGEGLLQGIEFFKQAIEIDPNYAPAYAGLSDCYNMLVVYGVQKPKEGFPKAKEAAIKALEIDDRLAEAHASLAFINFRWDWNRAEAEREFQQAIKLKPSYGPAHQWYSSFLAAVERFDEAIAAAKRTDELEPLSFVASSHLAWIYYLSGKSDLAIEQSKKILDRDPTSFPARRYLGLAYEQKEMYSEAIGEFDKGVKLSGSPLMLALLGHAYAVSGKRAEAEQVLNDLQQLQSQRYVSPYTVAAIYVGLGNEEEALKWLEKAVEERDIWLMNLKVDPVFARLHQNRRFTDLLARIRLKP